MIGCHFAGQDDLIKEVVFEMLEQGKTWMRHRILAEASTGPGFLRAYIEPNLAFMREHHNHVVAIVEIARGGITADGKQRFYGDADVDGAVQILAQHRVHFQAVGELRPDFAPLVIAVAIRAAIDAVPRRLAHDPDLDVDGHARERSPTSSVGRRASTHRYKLRPGARERQARHGFWFVRTVARGTAPRFGQQARLLVIAERRRGHPAAPRLFANEW